MQLPLRRSLMVLMVLAPYLSGCAIAQSGNVGERFGIGISQKFGDAKLEFGSAISDDKKIIISQPSAFQSYGISNGVRLPESVEFSWQIKGEKEVHLAKLNVRSSIPVAVLAMLDNDRQNGMVIELFVRDGRPSFRWTLLKIARGGNSTELSKGEMPVR
jgi:hypothetical protein